LITQVDFGFVVGFVFPSVGGQSDATFCIKNTRHVAFSLLFHGFLGIVYLQATIFGGVCQQSFTDLAQF
jgi:hypothetical protein